MRERVAWVWIAIVACACGGAGSDDAGAARDALVDTGAGCDGDGDGVDGASCGGDDCDDDDADRFPGNTEVCDTDDEDCDPSTFGRDVDGDGFADAACCDGDACGPDCDDMTALVRPGIAEACDGRDNDCNGLVDDGRDATFYLDADADGFGDAAAPTVMGCVVPEGYAAVATDCDDDNAMIHPGAAGACNCTAERTFDADDDGHIAISCGGDDCEDTEAGVHPGATETCNGLDEDCDGIPDYPIGGACTSCGQTALTPEFGCAGATFVCCQSGLSAPRSLLCTTQAACMPTCSPGGATVRSIECDGGADCPGTPVCCYVDACNQSLTRCRDSCAPDNVACHVDADCEAGRRCMASPVGFRLCRFP